MFGDSCRAKQYLQINVSIASSGKSGAGGCVTSVWLGPFWPHIRWTENAIKQFFLGTLTIFSCRFFLVYFFEGFKNCLHAGTFGHQTVSLEKDELSRIDPGRHIGYPWVLGIVILQNIYCLHHISNNVACMRAEIDNIVDIASTVRLEHAWVHLCSFCWSFVSYMSCWFRRFYGSYGFLGSIGLLAPWVLWSLLVRWVRHSSLGSGERVRSTLASPNCERALSWMHEDGNNGEHCLPNPFQGALSGKSGGESCECGMDHFDTMFSNQKNCTQIHIVLRPHDDLCRFCVYALAVFHTLLRCRHSLHQGAFFWNEKSRIESRGLREYLWMLMIANLLNARCLDSVL